MTQLGDLFVRAGAESFISLAIRPAQIADLVSVLRAEGVLVVEKVDGEWPDRAIEEMETIVARYYIASAEAQP